MAIYFARGGTWVRRAEDGSFPTVWDGLFFLDEKIADYIVAKTERGWTGAGGRFEDGAFVYGNVIERVDVESGRASFRVDPPAELWEVGLDVRHVYDRSSLPATVEGNAVRAGRFVIHFSSPILSIERRVHTPISREGPRETEIYVLRLGGGESLTISWKRAGRKVPWKVMGGTALKTETRLDTLYARARETLSILLGRRGFYAGLPWFTQYWARDFLWSVPALLREGYARAVGEGLLSLAFSARDGEIPRLVREDGTPEFGSVDANPLFVLGVRWYARLGGDVSAFRRILSELADTDTWVLGRAEGNSTWMDTIERRDYPVEVIALWYAAAKALEALGIEKGLSSWVRQRFEEKKGRYLLERTANVLVAGMTGLVTPTEALDMAEEWRLFGEGVRTLSPLEVEYDPAGYHTGSAWGLTTGWGLYVSALAGQWKTFWRLVDVLLRRGRYLDECWNSETGERLGADVQLWSAAMVIRTVDEVLIDMKRKPPGVKRIVRIRWGRGGLERITV